MTHKTFNLGVAAQIGAYSDAVETAPNLRWLFTSGTPGLEIDGNLPSDITGQAEVAWKHILQMLEQAGMTVDDVVKVTQYLTRAEDIPAYAAVRKRVLGGVEPAFMLLVVPHILQPIILAPNEFEEWLAPSERAPVHLLRVTPEEEMKMTLLNSAIPLGTKERAMRSLFD